MSICCRFCDYRGRGSADSTAHMTAVLAQRKTKVGRNSKAIRRHSRQQIDTGSNLRDVPSEGQAFLPAP